MQTVLCNLWRVWNAKGKKPELVVTRRKLYNDVVQQHKIIYTTTNEPKKIEWLCYIHVELQEKEGE